MDISRPVHFRLQRFPGKGGNPCVFILCGYGCELLSVFKIYCGIFPAKLCGDLGWIYGYFAVSGGYLMVCEREKHGFADSFGGDYWGLVQYDVCVWVDIF